ncbi:hypothetical protein K502DRAFT_12377 [Neoconidiobolus thromboides FSU 785]|nr:hypothetical protein K502DRAFT_12377 [Neoconidiobolus thromboides FSU 785]
MNLTRTLFAQVKIPKRHQPMIHFLGSRKSLNLQSKSGPSSVSTKQINQKATSSKESYTDNFGTNVYFIEENQLPAKFGRRLPSIAESECVMLGGAFN